MLHHDSQDSPSEPTTPFDPDPEWATLEEIEWISGKHFDLGWCAYFGIVAPDFESH